MKLLNTTGREDIAMVYLAEMEKGKVIEFVESVQPPIPREKKWVLIVSTLFGCPIGCRMCDAGGNYQGPLSRKELLAQIDYLIRRRYPDGCVPVSKFKIQFARMGEPSLNPAVLEVLKELPELYHAPGLIPCISTIAPAGTEGFFDRLLRIKKERYPNGKFQLQFSIHTTDDILRDQLIPARKWDMERIASFGERFYEKGDRKITLNFALVKGMPVDWEVLSRYFSPERFLIKITPVNPTYRAVKGGLSSYIDPHGEGKSNRVVEDLRSHGYEVIVSIGEVEENRIGSNCGQYVMRYLRSKEPIEGAYELPLNSMKNEERNRLEILESNTDWRD